MRTFFPPQVFLLLLGFTGCESDAAKSKSTETAPPDVTNLHPDATIRSDVTHPTGGPETVTTDDGSTDSDATGAVTTSDATTNDAVATDTGPVGETVGTATAQEDAQVDDTGATAGANVVAGTITYYGTRLPEPSERLHVGLFRFSETSCDPAAFVKGVELSVASFDSPVAYAIDGVPNGAYAVCAYFDVGADDADGSPGAGDPSGFYEGGPSPTFVSVGPDNETTHVDFVIGDEVPAPPEYGPNTVAGTVMYYGSTAPMPNERLHVGVFQWSEVACDPAAFVVGVELTQVSFASPFAYAIEDVPSGQYAVCAYHDFGDNNPTGGPGAEDPRGFYEGGPTPTFIEVSPLTDTTFVPIEIW